MAIQRPFRASRSSRRPAPPLQPGAAAMDAPVKAPAGSFWEQWGDFVAFVAIVAGLFLCFFALVAFGLSDYADALPFWPEVRR